MGKSSSSINKKKRSKYSPQGRIRKRSKIGKTKSKKLRRLYDSVSASDDGSRDSVSSSSSEDSYRDRRSKSHDKMDVKASKKRARAPSSGSEDFYCVRKRKGSKRRDDSQVRKKIHKTKTKRKKKIRRDASLSSRSSGLPSCSTCESPSSISDEGKYKNAQENLKEEVMIKGKWRMLKVEQEEDIGLGAALHVVDRMEVVII